MVSTFDDFFITLKEYPYDIITMSETWLRVTIFSSSKHNSNLSRFS